MKYHSFTIEELQSGGGFSVGGHKVTFARDTYSDHIVFSVSESKSSRHLDGTAECYGCHRTFPYYITPGAIPICDNCVRWMPE